MERPVRAAVPVFLTVNVRGAEVLPKLTLPKLTLAVPSVRLVPTGCSTAISGTATPVPVRLRSNGFSSASLLAMWMAAVRVPVAGGRTGTVKVVLPAAPMGEAGRATGKER